MPVITHKNGVNDAYWNINYADIKPRISLAKSYGANMYVCFISPSQIAAIKAGGADSFQAAINYAHSLGMKFKLLHNISWYPNGYTTTSRADFITNAATQTKFVNDLVWLTQHFTGLDGIELEEPHSWTVNQAVHLPFWKAFHLRCYNAMKPFLDTHINFDWGFNFIINSDSSMLGEGIDLAYLDAYKIFRTAYIQNSATQATFISNILRFKSKFTNIEMGVYNYLHAGGAAGYSSASCHANLNQAACWNQDFFKNAQYCHLNSYPQNIFILGRLGGTTALQFPAYAGKGSTPGAVLKTIWGTSLPPPPPPPQPTVETDPTKIVMALAGVGGLLYILDKEI